MKTANIALFKRFLYEHGVNTMFKGLYKQFGFKENPEDVEEYFLKIDQQNVILSAFKFPESMSGYKYGTDFWTDMAVKWEELVKKMTEGGSYYTSYPQVIERQKKEAETPLERIRKGLKNVILEKPPKAKLAVEPPKRETVDEEQAAVTGFRTVAANPTGTFKYFDLKKEGGKRRLNGDELSLSNKPTAYKLTFNKEVSALIQQRGLTNFRIGQDDVTREVRIVFGKFRDNAIPFTLAKSANVTIASKQLVGILSDIFDLKEQITILHLSKNIAKTEEYVSYVITK